MARIADIATFTVKELDLYKVEPVTREDWQVLNAYLAKVSGE